MIGEVTRITSKKTVIEFQPALYPLPENSQYSPTADYATYGEVLSHQTDLYLGGATSGTFKLVVDGEATAAITITAVSATNVTNIQNALEALPNVAPGEMTVTFVTDHYHIVCSGAMGSKFVIVEILDDLSVGTGVTQVVAVQGSAVYRIDGELFSFSYADNIESTDVTGMSEGARRSASTVSDANFDFSVYEALKPYRGIFTSGVEGYITVYEDGKTVGKRFFAWEVMLLEASSSFEQFEKIEIEVSGRRQGEPIRRVGSIYRG